MSNEEMVEHLRNRWLEPDPDPEPICRCDACGQDIFEGETVWDINGDTLCDDCAREQYSKEAGMNET